MELRHLRYFLAVAHEQHFTRAAERLGMQQPPLSLQIRALESELGFDLFVRHPRGASLTAGGAVFFEEAQAILASIDAASARAARAASGAAGQLAIGLTSSAAAHGLIPAVMRRYRAAWPGVQPPPYGHRRFSVDRNPGQRFGPRRRAEEVEADAVTENRLEERRARKVAIFSARCRAARLPAHPWRQPEGILTRAAAPV